MVELTNPPITTLASGRCTPAPVDVEVAMGMKPKLDKGGHQHGRQASARGLVFYSPLERLLDRGRREVNILRERFREQHFSKLGPVHFVQHLHPRTIHIDQGQIGPLW